MRRRQIYFVRLVQRVGIRFLLCRNQERTRRDEWGDMNHAEKPGQGASYAGPVATGKPTPVQIDFLLDSLESNNYCIGDSQRDS